MCPPSTTIPCTPLPHAAEEIKLPSAEAEDIMHPRNPSSLDTLTPLNFSQNIRISQAESALPLLGDSLDGTAGTAVSPTFTRSFTSTKLDALVLVEACLSERLSFCSRGPRRGEPSVASGSIFVYEHDASDDQERDDGITWTFVDFDGVFEILCSTDSSGLMKKRMSVKVDGTLHHLISYYMQWDTVNGLLKSPTRLLDFQDTILRNELAAQENMQSLSPMEQFRLDLEV